MFVSVKMLDNQTKMKHRNEKTINLTELQVQNTDHRSDDMIRLFQDQINQSINQLFELSKEPFPSPKFQFIHVTLPYHYYLIL